MTPRVFPPGLTHLVDARLRDEPTVDEEEQLLDIGDAGGTMPSPRTENRGEVGR